MATAAVKQSQILNVSGDSSTYFDYSSVELEDPPRFLPYDFEVYDWKEWCRYMSVKWHFCLIAGVIYIITIFGLKAFMSTRKALDLKRELFLWNLTLGIFSIVGFIRTAPEFFFVLSSENGFYKTICERSGGNMPLAFWSLAFILSKYVELGDTVFIVLRKRPLIFLQWYHHLMTMVMCWISAPYLEPISRYYVVMNYAVHSLMYPYFALKAINIQIPRFVSNVITTCQLTQMIVGLFVNMYTVYLINGAEADCYRHQVSMRLSFVVYGSFTVLFGKLFNDVVAKSRTIPKTKSS
ncbi:elongation of very long chain fatty acids protein 6 [Folsomia candida]|uniref:Elongation of very long chain fatty acids protein n=1 Tax=Folsomia candida TaxID=158441 RepID=A0A226EZ07_FOLCA|nr:elongation of very long chain fatty acids protein 6 [Folsomia candida]OXA61886.1 putative fatty acid elongation protein 3 [Folsomia candida]